MQQYNPNNILELDDKVFDKILNGIRREQLQKSFEIEFIRNELCELEKTCSRKIMDRDNDAHSLVNNIISMCEKWKNGENCSPGISGTCVLCLDTNPSCIARPCNHLILCRDCYESTPPEYFENTCPKCKRNVTHLEIIYT